MTGFDRFLQRARIKQAATYISKDSRVLDIGTIDGALFLTLPYLKDGCGIDPLVDPSSQLPNARLFRGYFPEVLPPDSKPFDVITMLAVLEHIPNNLQSTLAANCFAHLRPGGRLIITVPSPQVDKLLAVLKVIRVIHGMSLEEHYGYDVDHTPTLFCTAGFTLLKHRRFQLGLNNLFVFERPRL